MDTSAVTEQPMRPGLKAEKLMLCKHVTQELMASGCTPVHSDTQLVHLQGKVQDIPVFLRGPPRLLRLPSELLVRVISI